MEIEYIPVHKVCNTCVHYYATRPDADVTRECHRFPPTVFLRFKDAPTTEDPHAFVAQKFVAYPTPEPDWACAEWTNLQSAK